MTEHRDQSPAEVLSALKRLKGRRSMTVVEAVDELRLAGYGVAKDRLGYRITRDGEFVASYSRALGLYGIHYGEVGYGNRIEPENLRAAVDALREDR